jgi:hypothetical protein
VKRTPYYRQFPAPSADILDESVGVKPAITEKGAVKRLYKGKKMKKPVFPRFVALTVLYMTVFIMLLRIQFPLDALVLRRPAVPRPVPVNRYFNPADFILPDAESAATYDALLAQWSDTNFVLWSKRVVDGSAAFSKTAVAEDTVLAYLAAALTRGEYAAALAAIPDGYEQSSGSSVFLGSLYQGLRALADEERAAEAQFLRLSSLNGGDLLDSLRSSGDTAARATELRAAALLEGLAVRGSFDQLSGVARGIRVVAPAAVLLGNTPEIFAGYTVWEEYAALGADNPFTQLLDPAFHLLGDALTLHPDGKRVFVCDESVADIAFNLRLAQTLIRYAGERDSALAALGRSLILSALSLSDESGTLPARLFFTFSSSDNVREDTERLDSSCVYLLLDMGGYAPHAVHLGGSAWLWTAAVAAPLNNSGATKLPAPPLDLAVSFPAGQTHYLFLRGFPRPSSIRLHGADVPANPNFEEDLSGWSYSPSTQSVLLKLTHREAIEHIVVSY